MIKHIARVSYYEHTKKNAPDTHPKTVKCVYTTTDDEKIYRFLCAEHPAGQYPHNQFLSFWKAHMPEDMEPPTTALEASRLLYEHAKKPVALEVVQDEESGFYEVKKTLFDVPIGAADYGARQDEPEPTPPDDEGYDDLPF